MFTLRAHVPASLLRLDCHVLTSCIFSFACHGARLLLRANALHARSSCSSHVSHSALLDVSMSAPWFAHSAVFSLPSMLTLILFFIFFLSYVT